MSDGDAENLAAIRARVEAEPTWRGGSDEEFHCRADRRWLLARVGQLEALVAAKDQVMQRLIREHNEEMRVAKGEPERTPRGRK